MDSEGIYDLIIIGSGPAGLTASIYASCFHLKHLVVGGLLGGQLHFAPTILNYPGFNQISGKELTDKMVEQVEVRGGEIVVANVTKITEVKMVDSGREGNNLKGFEVETKEGSKYRCKAIILATGTERRKLNVPGETEYTGKGIRYCATCEEIDYEGKTCLVVGGANSAVQAAVELAQAARKVYIIYRGTELRGDHVWLEQIEKNSNIEVIYNTVASEITGDGETVKGVKTEPGGKELAIDRVFIEIGGVPGTALVIPLGVKMDPGGYIIVDEYLATNIAGIFAAGDLVSYGLSIEQISTAVGLGARAAESAFAYIKKIKAPIVWGESQIRR